MQIMQMKDKETSQREDARVVFYERENQVGTEFRHQSRMQHQRLQLQCTGRRYTKMLQLSAANTEKTKQDAWMLVKYIEHTKAGRISAARSALKPNTFGCSKSISTHHYTDWTPLHSNFPQHWIVIKGDNSTLECHSWYITDWQTDSPSHYDTQIKKHFVASPIKIITLKLIMHHFIAVTMYEGHAREEASSHRGTPPVYAHTTQRRKLDSFEILNWVAGSLGTKLLRNRIKGVISTKKQRYQRAVN